MASLLLLAALSAGTSMTVAATLGQQLREKDQALLTAMAPGDRALWDSLLAPNAVYVDENGVVMDRETFLKSLQPLPSYASGSLTITGYRLTRVGDTALVVHRDEEEEIYHGIPLHASYLMTETWLRRRGSWKLALVHAHVVAKDPPAAALPAAALQEYVGRYTLGDSGVFFVIRREGDGLVGGTVGKSLQPLRPEAPDLFFVPGQPRVRLIFRRGPDHRITDFVNRREAEDLVFRRLDPSPGA